MNKNINKALALYGIYFARLYQHALKNEQNKYLKEITAIVKNKQNFNNKELIEKVRQDLIQDHKYLNKINEEIKHYPNQDELHFGVRTNKMDLILTGISVLFHNDKNIIDITNGRLPEDYDNTIYGLPKANKNTYYGSSKSTFISGAIYSIYYTITKTNINKVDIFNSPVVHVVDCPKNFIIESNYRWYYQQPYESDTNKINGFGFVHSGYSFDGSRNQKKLYPYGKKFAPQDCSSYVNKITACPELLSTIDYLGIYRTITRKGFIPSTWKLSEAAKYINLYEAIENKKDIKIGDIYFHREFNKTNTEENSLGIAGHTAIVIDVLENIVLTVGANRDMPYLEGILLQEFEINPTSLNEKAFFLRLKPEYITNLPQLPDGSSFTSLCDEYNGEKDLGSIIEIFDKIIMGQSDHQNDEI